MSQLVRFPMSSLLDSVFSDFGWEGKFSPAMDIAETDGEYVVRMDVPGVKEKDLNVEIRDNVLTVRGHREYNYDEGVGGLTRYERSHGTFQRSIALPRGSEEINAQLEDGVLTLRIGKPVEAQPRRIEIDSRKAIEA